MSNYVKLRKIQKAKDLRYINFIVSVIQCSDNIHKRKQ